MNEIEINNIILDYCAKAVELKYLISPERLNVFWNDLGNKWETGAINISCLTAVLLISQKMPDIKLQKSDDVAMSTLSILFGKPESWLNSFQDGFQGLKNSHQSIGGFIAGYNIRKYLL